MRLKLVTFNVGLLDIPGGIFQPVHFVQERLHGLAASLRKFDADIVALQEIYREPHQRLVWSATRDTYPFSSYARKYCKFGLGSGLMTLSKYALSSIATVFRSAPLDEKLFTSKGILISQVHLTNCLKVRLLNVHTTAGGTLCHPQSAYIERIRARQIEQLLHLAGQEPGVVTIIAGDMNVGPGVSEGNYNLFQEHGFVDAYAFVCGATNEVTWDPNNSLNRGGPYGSCPPQRVDHIMVRQTDLESGRIRPLQSMIQSREEVVEVRSVKKVTLSDHYSLRVCFDIADLPASGLSARTYPPP